MKKPKKPKLRIPTAKGSLVHRDKKSDYSRQREKKQYEGQPSKDEEHFYKYHFDDPDGSYDEYIDDLDDELF